MAQERGRPLVAAATAVVIMMVTMPILFHCEVVAEAAVADTLVTWSLRINVFETYGADKGMTLPEGSTLVFKSEFGKPNVTEVMTKDEFTNCKVVNGTPFPAQGAKLLPGDHLFFCAIEDHCINYGMKIRVNAK